jgi:ketosteroid isomerase-like protein
MRRLAIVTLVLSAACASSNNNDVIPGDAERAIAQQNQSFMAAARGGSIDQLMKFYGDSAVVLPPNAPAITGSSAIRQFWTGFLGTYNVDGRLISDDVQQSCADMAAERGHFTLTLTPKNGGLPMTDNGKYVVVWRKTNGTWRASMDIFNSDMPGR